MYTLGLNAYHADAAAALFKDGMLVAATEEERFCRVKHWAGFPATAISFCLQEAGISLDQVDQIAIGRDPKAKRWNKIKFFASRPWETIPHAVERLLNQQKVASVEHALAKHFNLPATELAAKIHRVEHHRAHLASAFYASPFEEAALISIDGSGDFTTTMLAMGKGKDIQVLESLDFPHSLGIFYTAFTQLLGFPHYGDEYKVMGLAPYGEPVYLDQLRDVVQLIPGGLFQLNLDYFRSPGKGFVQYNPHHIPEIPVAYSAKMEAVFGRARTKDIPLTQHHKNLAASVQRMAEQTIFHLLKRLHALTGCQQVCLAGGVAQNSVANGKLLQNSSFDEVYIPSAGHDAGIAFGAAQYVYHQTLQQARVAPIFNAYTGIQFSNADIKSILTQKGIRFHEMPDEELFPFLAEQLTQGAVLGWFNGRAEFGPRALGARSILADPSRPDAKDLINAKIKRRESFRPFAPSILEEKVSDYFEQTGPVPFMEKVFKIKAEKRALIPAVTHADGTGRLQTVNKEVSPRYYGLIQAFEHKTGIPILLNTSFNENEPIVNRPEEALDCFLRTAMDLLVMENIVVKR